MFIFSLSTFQSKKSDVVPLVRDHVMKYLCFQRNVLSNTALETVYCVMFMQSARFPSYSNVSKMLTACSLNFSGPYSACVFIKRDVCVVGCTNKEVNSNFLRRKLDSAI